MPLREKKQRWEIRVQLRGERKSWLTELPATEETRAEAERMEEAWRRELEAEFASRALPLRKSFSRALDEFMEYCAMRYSDHPSSAKRIQTTMASAVQAFSSYGVHEIGARELNRYCLSRRNVDEVKDVTIRHDLHNLSVFFKWAVMEGLCDNNPVRLIHIPSDLHAVRQHILTKDEERTYCEVARGNLLSIARLMLNQGLRPSEAMSLPKRAVILAGDSAWVHITQGKTRAAHRKLRLTEESAAILREQMRTPGPWVFPGKTPATHMQKLQSAHDRVVRLTGIDCDLYDLRHTFATRLAQMGIDLFTLARILGHSNIRTLHRYVHIGQEHQDEAMRQYDQHLRQQPKKEELHDDN